MARSRKPKKLYRFEGTLWTNDGQIGPWESKTLAVSWKQAASQMAYQAKMNYNLAANYPAWIEGHMRVDENEVVIRDGCSRAEAKLIQDILDGKFVEKEAVQLTLPLGNLK